MCDGWETQRPLSQLSSALWLWFLKPWLTYSCFCSVSHSPSGNCKISSRTQHISVNYFHRKIWMLYWKCGSHYWQSHQRRIPDSLGELPLVINQLLLILWAGWGDMCPILGEEYFLPWKHMAINKPRKNEEGCVWVSSSYFHKNTWFWDSPQFIWQHTPPGSLEPLWQAIQYLKAPNGILFSRSLSQPLLWDQLHPSPPPLNLYIEVLTPSNSVFRGKVLQKVTMLKWGQKREL